MTSKIKMPTVQEFDAVTKRLVAAGWEYRLTMMVDDAKKDGVTNFGKLFNRNGQEFWLNYKTIASLPDGV